MAASSYAQGTINPSYANVGVELRMVNDGELYLRGNGDMNHGLGWYGIVGRDPKIWNSQTIDGPVLYGYNGGVLGTNQFGTQQTVLRWNGAGQVIIGNVTAPSANDYRLYVEKGILTEHVRVAVSTTADWHDEVFDTNYPLMSLAGLRAFINANHHLPEIPSAQEVVKNGIDVQQIDSRLLQKVEEMTLYILSQQDQIDDLKAKIAKLEAASEHK
jgi:hypothetical protein